MIFKSLLTISIHVITGLLLFIIHHFIYLITKSFFSSSLTTLTDHLTGKIQQRNACSLILILCQQMQQ